MAEVTMRQIAKAAGVSPATVALVLNDTPTARIAEATRERVLATARQLDYHGSLLRRAVKAPLRHFGLLRHRSQGKWPGISPLTEVLAGAREEMLRRGFLPIEVDSGVLLDRDPESVIAGREIVTPLRRLHSSRLFDGFLVDKEGFATRAIEELDKHGIPIVLVNGVPVRSPRTEELVPHVPLDYHLSGAMAAEHLIRLGHRRIAMLTYSYHDVSPDARPYWLEHFVAGWRETMAQGGIGLADAGPHIDGDLQDEQRTYAAVGTLLADRRRRPTAIIACDDGLAVMALNAVRRHGLRVPEDVSVVGFGGRRVVCRLAEPALTTISLPWQASGRKAAQLLVSLVQTKSNESENGEVVEDEPDSLAPRLLVRNSSGPCAGPPA